ncbi:hypothetical protein [Kutzneria sp. CA-103260]|uniref:hypothetical protein n=1 Tax=Kutzneria sp. CA-103260 TaxID=2802641 RepID=UPI001BA85155|nr:hypothetical protein [Kutzneria sp. CA-103260]QUQ63803.1 hypothetical protein JJ691_15160 [Kutzneria sp. CA-103260]
MASVADWQSFAVMTGGASGALTGLLFVAVSLNANRIARHRALRASAGQTLVLFLVPLIMATVLLVPGQPEWALGAELIAVGLGAAVSLLNIGRRRREPAEDKWLVSVFDRRDTNVIVMLLVVASGAVLIAGASAGLYLLVPAALVAFLSGVVNAWNFLLPPPGEHTDQPPGP